MEDTVFDLSDVGSLVELLHIRASQQANKVAYTYLVDGEKQELHITYAELDKRARVIAVKLRDLNLQGERAVLLFPQGLDYIIAFFGCLYAGVIAVPAYPPRNKRHLPRLKTIIDDSKAKIILGTSAIADAINGLFETNNDINIPILQTDMLVNDVDSWRLPMFDTDEVAFLQYTSGSTGNAKGVMVTHANLMANQRYIKNSFGHDQNSTVVGWLPFYHDMGLIGNIMQPLYIGAPAILMSPMAFLEKPLRWLNAISEYRAHTSGAPNFAFDLCVQKISVEEKAQLDLSSWKLAFNGSEPIHAETLDRFAEAFACCGFQREAFYPCYGLAEATLLVTGGEKALSPITKSYSKAGLEQHIASTKLSDNDEFRKLVGCGCVGNDHHIRIVDPDTLVVRESNRIGEIQVSGPSITKGYWLIAVATTESFIQDENNIRWLRTGDLGFIDSSELYVCGRMKDLIIVRGRNYYPQDIECVAESAVDCLNQGCSAAFGVQSGEGEKLILLAEVKRSYLKQDNFSSEFSAIRSCLVDECGIQAHAVLFVKPGTILKTSSGKIRRSDNKTLFLRNELEIIAADYLDLSEQKNHTVKFEVKGSPFENPKFHSLPELSKLRQSLLSASKIGCIDLLTRYLSVKVAVLSGLALEQINISTPLLHLGIDSLKSVELKYLIDDLLGVDLPLGLFFDEKTLNNIVEIALNLAKEKAESTAEVYKVINIQQKTSQTNRIPLSQGQRAIWTVSQVETESVIYNLAVALQIQSAINIEALKDAMQFLIERHEQLRVRFVVDENLLPVQIPIDEPKFQFDHIFCNSENQRQQQISSAIKIPFDLEHGPLLRVELFSCSDTDHILLFCAHHIIADLRSMSILLDELRQVYRGFDLGHQPQLQPITESYNEFVCWQQSYLEGKQSEKALRYWHQQLLGEISKVELPFDKFRPNEQSHGGAIETIILDQQIVEQLRILAIQNGSTLYMTLLCIFKILLYRYSGQQDIIVGSPIAGRGKYEFSNLVGYFVNTVALRSSPNGTMTFLQYLAEVRGVVLGALQNQDYPFPLLVEKLQPERANGLWPFYQVMFALQGDADSYSEAAALALGIPNIEINWSGLDVKSAKIKDTIVQFDLVLMTAVTQSGLLVSFQYSTELFENATISRMLGHFQCLIEGVLNNPNQRLVDLPLLPESECCQLLYGFNATEVEFPQEVCIHQLFERQVECDPNVAALVFEGQILSYGELNRHANRLAHRLVELGIRPDDRVAICAERSLGMVISLLAILKAGGCYVPLDPGYPEERLAYMLSDSDPVAVLAQTEVWGRLSSLGESLGSSPIPVVLLDQDGVGQEAQPTGELSEAANLAGLCVGYPEHNPEPAQLGLTSRHLAYVIYTSGSTGQPKGVMNQHKGVVNRLWWAQNEYQLTVDDRILQKTPFSFDVSVWEFFLPLMAGSQLVLAKPQGHQDAEYLSAIILASQITTVHFVPSMLQVFLDQADVHPCDSSLRRVLCSGEALPFSLQMRFHNLLPTVELHNLYGPTEAAIDVTSWLCSPEHGIKIVPIGYPIANTQIYILDSHLQPVPLGGTGEIYIGGAGVACGYLGRPELTAERFIANPFSQCQVNLAGVVDATPFKYKDSPNTSEGISNRNDAFPSGRLYKTGDLGRWLPDGSIEYLGRNDFQVKIRGFRVELGEIEAQLTKCPGVKEAVVTAREDVSGDKRLVAYLVIGIDEKPSLVDFKTILKQSLPGYMIPAQFISLPSMPLTANGKIDRKALLAMDNLYLQRQEFVAPRDEAEQFVADIWQQILGVKQIGIYDDFFDLGGHSLSAVQVIAKMQESFAIKVPVKTIFEAPTIAEFVNRIAEYQDD
ncbi:MAG: amino acid adenylation domain-containing protein [Methylococcaceae bacterium]|nr:amino acid adenylation domain-containing protein [Methylococcaceae bacterium]